jgi:hypothetical protein
MDTYNNLQTRLLRINSRFRSGGTTSNFTEIFSNRLVDNVQGIELISASIPRLFTNVYAPINELRYTINGLLYSYFVQEGQYTAPQLATLLNLSSDFICTYQQEEKRFRFEFSGTPFDTIILASSPIARYIGISEDLPLFPAQPINASDPPSLEGPSQIYVQSKFLASSNCVDTEQIGQFIPLMARIDCSAVPYGFNIGYESKRSENSMLRFSDQGNASRQNLRAVDIELTDQFGNNLNLPRTSDCDLLFRMYIQP